jgi:transposase-like protein
MAYPAYVREKARELRLERRLSIVEIAERLALPKTTIFYWVRDIPLGRPRRDNSRPATRAMQDKFRGRREAAYAQGKREFVELAAIPTFRDFVCLYIAEGSKRQRNTVAIANSDPKVIALAASWIRRFSRNPVRFYLQYHADQRVDELTRFWGEIVGVDSSEVGLQRKSNSNQLRKRTWRSQHGVLTVRACDTLFRARLQAWMDCLREQWLNSPAIGA